MGCNLLKPQHHQKIQVPKMEGFLNLIASYVGGGGFTALHKPYVPTAYIGEDEPSILGTNEMFGDNMTWGKTSQLHGCPGSVKCGSDQW